MTTNQSILLLSLSLFILTTCNNSSQPKIIENQNKPTDTISTNIAANIETTAYDITTFPIEASFTNKVLTVGTFHGDEVISNLDELKWMGLFQNKTGFYIAETQLKTKRVHDVIVDENENEKTGWNVQTINTDASIILFEGLSAITPHNVKQVLLLKDQVFPGDTLRINYLGIDYIIFATGIIKKIPNDASMLEVWNYKLYLSATIKGKQHKSLLVAQPNFDNEMITIIFAGDMDGDGILDLIIDTSRHYNITSPTLYLSKPTNSGEVVKPIGRHTSVGC